MIINSSIATALSNAEFASFTSNRYTATQKCVALVSLNMSFINYSNTNSETMWCKVSKNGTQVDKLTVTAAPSTSFNRTLTAVIELDNNDYITVSSGNNDTSSTEKPTLNKNLVIVAE